MNSWVKVPIKIKHMGLTALKHDRFSMMPKSFLLFTPISLRYNAPAP